MENQFERFGEQSQEAESTSNLNLLKAFLAGDSVRTKGATVSDREPLKQQQKNPQGPDNESDTVIATRPAALIRVAELQERRTEIEANLPPDKREALQRHRMTLSTSDDPGKRQEYRNLIDRVDPALAKLNRELERTLDLSFRLPLDTRPQQNALANVRTISTTDCHQPQKLERSSETLFDHTQRDRRISELQDGWYAPYSGLHKFSKSHGINLDLKKEGDELVPKFSIFSLETMSRWDLPLDTTRDLESQINALIETKLDQMEKQYNVHFSRAGEEVTKPFHTHADGSKTFVEGAHILTARQPSLDEIHGIENALQVSKPTLDGPTLQVCFLSEYIRPGGAKDAEYFTEMNGKPAIAFYSANSVVTHPRRLALHELAHHSQYKSGLLNEAHNLNETELSSDLGWKKSRGTDRDWLLEGIGTDFYKFGGDDTWILCNSEGQATDEQGQPVEHQDEVILSSKRVRERAMFVPPTEYFNNAVEEHAEALTCFRRSVAEREELYRSSPRLYNVAKELDQREIDQYARRHFGNDGAIRLPDGRIERKSAETELAVASFERTLRNHPGLNFREDRQLYSKYFKLTNDDRPASPKDGPQYERLSKQLEGLSKRYEEQIAELRKTSNADTFKGQLLHNYEMDLRSYKDMAAKVAERWNRLGK